MRTKGIGKTIKTMRKIKFQSKPPNAQMTQYMWVDGKDWLECTGEKDKNGTEIYEGNIVRVLFGRQQKARDLIVEWKKGGFTPRTLSKGHWEVIGNIYDKTNE